MMSGAIGFRVPAKKLFFNSKEIVERMDPKKRRFLSKFGAFVRRTARSSIKSGGKSRKTSRPGEPPRTQTKNGLKERSSIQFWPDRRLENVIIGPILRQNRKGGPDALRTIEEGGSTMVEELVLKSGSRRRKFDRDDYIRTGRRVRARIAARPYMFPAFENEKSQISEIWKKANPKG